MASLIISTIQKGVTPLKIVAVETSPITPGNHGVKVHAQYSNRLEHTLFIVCEADSFEALDAAFDPILEMGHFEVTPVVKRD